MQNLDLKNIFEWPRSMQGIIFAMIFVLVLYFGYLLDISNLRLELSSARAQEGELLSQVERGIRMEAAISKDVSRFPVLSTQLAQWRNNLVKKTSIPDIINEILKIGASNHVTFDLLNPDEMVKVGSYIKVPIRAKVVGTYQELGHFVSQIANLPWIVVVSDFTITNDGSGSNSGTVMPSSEALSGDFIFEVYSLAEPESGQKT